MLAGLLSCLQGQGLPGNSINISIRTSGSLRQSRDTVDAAGAGRTVTLLQDSPSVAGDCKAVVMLYTDFCVGAERPGSDPDLLWTKAI